MLTLNRSRIAIAVAAVALTGGLGIAQAAPLPEGTLLTIEPGISISNPSHGCNPGSCFSWDSYFPTITSFGVEGGSDAGAVEILTGHPTWYNIEGGTDGGFIVGKNQLSGGQENEPAGETTPTPGELTNAWSFFASWNTLFADNTQNVFSDTSNDGTTRLNDYNIARAGEIIAMGGGTVHDYIITLDDSGNGTYSLIYSRFISEGVFAGLTFATIIRGNVITPTDSPPVVSDLNLAVVTGQSINWTPNFIDYPGDRHTCSITTNGQLGNATVSADCASGTYTAADGVEGVDSFSYTVTDQDGLSGTANGIVDVAMSQSTICKLNFPTKRVVTDGGGQGSVVNSTLETRFTGHIMTASGLTSGGKNTVKICPGTTVDYWARGSGTELCRINGVAANYFGTLAIGDKLICTNKPDGSDTDRFSVKDGGF